MRFRITAAVLSTLVLVAVLLGCTSSEIVIIPDENLEVELEYYLNKPAGDEITSDEMASLTGLSFGDINITDLSGLEYCTNLTDLHLYRTQINDISILSLLANLTILNLNENQLSDISPLSSLTNLVKLYLSENQIIDISPLSSLNQVDQALPK